MSSHYKLTYFDGLRGRAEAIRYILTLGGTAWEEVPVKYEDWKKIKPTIKPFNQLPVLDIDNGAVLLGETVAICRYLANELGLNGDTNIEKAKADMVVDAAADLWHKYHDIVAAKIGQKNMEKAAAAQKEFFEQAFPIFCNKLEPFLQETAWFIGNKPSWADVYVAEFLSRLRDALDEKCLDSYPNLKSLVARVHEIPSIAAYVAGRTSNAFP